MRKACVGRHVARRKRGTWEEAERGGWEQGCARLKVKRGVRDWT